MALALYRKYRPRTFAEVIGQEHVTEPLIQALKSGRLNHAYLFSGPRGCGKTSSARILARSLNCDQGPTPTPCGECESCRALAPDGPGSIDVIEIDAASHGGVDDARELRERAFFTPAISRYKIYIIDEAHMVSSAGFNALLKLVEEPPDYVKFVFATTEPEKVLGTIKSRTHHYPFRLIPPGVLRPYLEQLAAAEGVKVDPQVFPLVVRAGGGSARDALSVLDQLISGSGAEGVAYSRAVALLGVTDVALIDEMVDAVAASDGASAFAAVDKVAEAGHDSRRFAGDLLERLRDLIVLRHVPDAAANGLISAPEDELTRMRDQASRLGPATLSRCADIIHNGLVEMRGATSPRLLLELLVARMLLPVIDDSAAALLQRLERVERGIPSAGPNSAAEPSAAHTPASAPQANAAHASANAPQPNAPQPNTAHASQAHASQANASQANAPQASVAQPPRERLADPAPAVPAPVAPQATPARSVPSDVPANAPVSAPVSVSPASASGTDAAAVRRSWDEIMRMVSQTSKKAAAFAREAVVRDIDGDTVVLVFKHKVHASGVDNEPTQLIEAMHQVLGGTWRVRCEVGGDQRSAAAAPARSAPQRPQAASHTPQRAETTSDGDWPTPAAVGGVSSTPAPRSAVQTARSAPMVDEEPPYDPEFDGPVKPASIEGFDPGDEPTDQVIDEAGARQTSEQRAIDTLKLSFDVEKLN